MTVSGMEAWVTSAVGEKDVKKAILLALSLRRVTTAKKLVVLASVTLSQDSSEKLKEVFDQVILLKPETPNGLSLEDYAKVEAFSLLLFTKCVYLSPNTIVLKNCDDIFDKYDNFAAWGLGKWLDSSVYLFTPSLESSRGLRNIIHLGESLAHGKNGGGRFAKCFNLWIQKLNMLNWEKLDVKYNAILDLNGGGAKSLSSKVTIANLGDGPHPMDFVEGRVGMIEEKRRGWGPIENLVVDLCENFCGGAKGNPSLDPSFHYELYKNEPIAIVGMSFRLPGGNSLDEFWDLLVNGREAVRPLPDSRWTREHTHIPCQNREVEAGFLTTPVDEFDGKFFGISGKEAEVMDPQHRLLLEVAWEAFEDAMIDPLSVRGSQTGIFVGSWLHDYRDMIMGTTDMEFFRRYMGTSIAAGAARLSHFLGTTGPSISTESGCSSAMVGVDMACKSLRMRDSNLALACGVNLLLKPFDHNTISVVFSPDYRCKTFDAEANGYVRAEACAVLLMKRLSDAVRDEDNIWGMIRGSAVTQEGLSDSFGTPTVHSESLAMKLALKDGHVDPAHVSYVEAHGTGTVVGDPMEIDAIAKAYHSKGRSDPLLIGSVKTNVGHTESVSGITGIVKVLLAMKNEKIPPHLNLTRLNPAINLEAIPAKIPLEVVAWPKHDHMPRLAGVSSFGISGSDSHVIIQEPPFPNSILQNYKNNSSPRPLHIMKISAKSPESLQELLETYEETFSAREGDQEENGFADMAYSVNTGRATFNHRAVIIAKDFTEAKNSLKSKSLRQAEVQPSQAGQLCFLFTGQGSQYPNMGATLYSTSPIFKEVFDKCEIILTKQYGIDLRKVLWGGDSNEEVNRSLYSQTGIFVIEYCLLKLWESWGITPDYVMGHSMGETAAAAAAGVLDFEDALMLITERSRLIDSLPPGKMLVIQADQKTVAENIDECKQANPNFWVDFAAINSPEQTVVAGDPSYIEKFASFCKEKSLKTTMLAATHAFHSRHMEPVLEEYRRVAQRVKPFQFGRQCPKYISGMEGKLVDLELIDADYWVRHAREPVNFMGAIKTAQLEGCNLFLELGPHPVLSALTMLNLGDGEASVTCLPSLRRKGDDWVTMLDSLSKLYFSDWNGSIDWKGFDQYYKRSRVPLPFYPFNRKPVWRDMEGIPPITHPLLGRRNPTHCDHTIFEHKLTLKNTPFVKDHVIGNTVIFPGAAYLEMCLAGGYAAIQGASILGGCDRIKPPRPIALRSLKIHSPLAMYDSGIYRLQTSIKLDNTDDNGEIQYLVGVHRYVTTSASDEVGEWIKHATGKYIPVTITSTSNASSIIDIQSIQNNWEEAESTGFYSRISEVGLSFGPKFHNLGMGWKSGKELLIKVNTPEETDKGYLIHPIVVDAMIQASMLWRNSDMEGKMKLQVPIRMEEFILLGTSKSTSSDRYIYCGENSEGKINSILLDEQGTHLAQMTGVDFVETSVKLMQCMIQQHASAMPKLWREVWKSSPLEELAPAPLDILEKCSWLIFCHDANLNFAHILEKKLVGVNRNVRIVTSPPTFTESGMSDLITSAYLAGTPEERIEGVIYLWGLSKDGVTDRDQCNVSLPLITLIKRMLTSEAPHPQLYVITQGTASADGLDVTNPSAGTLHGIIKSLSNEVTELQLCHLDLSPEDSELNQVDNIFSEFLRTNDGSRHIAFRNGERLCMKFTSAQVNNNEPLPLPSGCDRFQLLLPQSRLISDLEFGVLENYTLGENEVEVQVKAVALNFRDVFVVLKPIPKFEEMNTVGLDFSGVITKLGSNVRNRKVGERVIGMNMEDNLSLPSHIKIEESRVVPFGSSYTYAEGVTLPAVYSTAVHSLIKVAKMRKGETVLIHTASGGVGLRAIQLARRLGVEVIATAGSKRKQNYLRSLGIQHVFHSRTTEFGPKIMEVTNGRGVNIVLNSITGEGFKEASLSALAKNGRFIEMSKLNVWTPEEVKLLRPDVFYQIVDLTALDKLELQELMGQLGNDLEENSISPIPYERFDALNIRGALNHLQKAKHIGKIVCVMPEVKIQNSKILATTPLFNESSTYLVTGGLGGIGWEVVKWMLSSGAKHIAIVSRSRPQPTIQRQLDIWSKNGKHVETFSVDIADVDQCRHLFQELKSTHRGFPQIRGIMHAAGVLSDALVENQTWENFTKTYNPKVNGTWNLHDMTKELLLEHFVVFSSLAASVGSPGQSNHAASNSFQDALAAYRRSNGLPATSIKWGNWGEVGIATEVDFPGVRPITTAQGILALETILKSQDTHLTVSNFESFALAVKLFPSLKNFVEDKRLFGELKETSIINSVKFWKDVDKAEDLQGRLLLFKDAIKSILKNILKMDQDEEIDESANFQTLGVDSLMMLEMRNGLQNILGVRFTLTANQLKESSSTSALANLLVGTI